MKFTIKKWMKNDEFSFAVFKAEDVKGMGFLILSPDIEPLIYQLSRDEAEHFKKLLNKEARNE
jgi:hypothetical protein